MRAVRASPLYALLLLLGGCGCPTFREMHITDPDGVAVDQQLDLVAHSLQRFQEWTALEGVCVPEIQVVDHLPGFDGFYAGPHRPIHINDRVDDPREITLHELCHGADDSLGFPSDANASLFPETRIQNTDTYRTENARQREAFARACESGPRDFALLDALTPLCGDRRRPVDQAMRDILYAGYTDAPAPDDLVPLTADHLSPRLPLEALAPYRLHRVAPADDGGLYLILIAHERPDDPPFFARLDPETRQLSGIWSLPEAGENLLWSLLPADSGPPLVICAGLTGARAYRLRADSTWRPVAGLPDLAPQARVRGFLEGDRLWGAALLRDQPHEDLFFIDLDRARQTLQTLRLPAQGSLLSLDAVSPLPDGRVLVSATDADGTRLYRSPRSSGDGWEIHRPPLQTTGTIRPLSDGRLLLPWTQAAAEGDLLGLATWSLDSGRWDVLGDPCGADAWTSPPFPVPQGDTVWIFEDLGAPAGLGLGRLTPPPPAP